MSENDHGAELAAVGNDTTVASDPASHAAPTFTPGPWRVRRAQYPVDGAYDYAIYDEPLVQVIAETFGRTSVTNWPDAEANAHLIAAAPELYEALKTLDARGWTTATWDLAKRALAKAEGRS